MQGCKETVLIADIGGTNCRFELWRIDSSGEKNHQELYHRVSASRLCMCSLERNCKARHEIRAISIMTWS